MIPWAGAALASPCPGPDDARCSCEQARTREVAEALDGWERSPIGEATRGQWVQVAEATCNWAAGLSATPSCVPTATCVRALTESRLGSLATTTPAARARDLARWTGRVDCVPAAGPACALEARGVEFDRLNRLVDALERYGWSPREAQRHWLAYRDAACEAEAEGSPDPAWSRAACEVVLTVRRADILTELVDAVGPELSAQVADARAPLGRVERRWLRSVGDGPAARNAVREALEARADGAVYPPVLDTHAAAGCSLDDDACVDAIAVEAAAARSGLPVDARERALRRHWCAPDEPVCAATVDLVVGAARD